MQICYSKLFSKMSSTIDCIWLDSPRSGFFADCWGNGIIRLIIDNVHRLGWRFSYLRFDVGIRFVVGISIQVTEVGVGGSGL